MMNKMKDVVHDILNSSVIGLVHAVNSTILLALGHFAAQLSILSTPSMPKLEVVLARSVFQFIMLMPFVLLFRSKVLHPPDKWLMIFFLSIFGYFCYIALYLILDLVPLSIALAISGTCPFFASIFSYIILKERIRCLEITCGIVSLFGVLLIARPRAIFGKYGKKSDTFHKGMAPGRYETLYLTGCGIAVIFGLARALYLIFARKWSREAIGRTNQIVTVVYPSVFSIFFTPMLMLFKGDQLKVPSEAYGTCCILLVGILTSLGLMSLTLAIKTQNATVVGVIRNLEIIWAFVLQYLVLGLTPSWWNLAGSALIVCATIVASLSNYIYNSFCSHEHN